ncbi:MAG: heparan-alpha-glucosaminide N-acetyltransferase domain-containing protein, partial [Oscillospiraceae bacterium]
SVCLYSKNNLKRGLKCLGLGIALTIITFLFFKNMIIYFGILHFLGVSMIIYALLEKWFKKIKPSVLIIVGIVLFFVTFGVPEGYINIFFSKIYLPQVKNNLLMPLGFVTKHFYSADYFSLLPWFFIFISGIGFGKLLKEERLPKFFYNSHIKFLSVIGRNTIWIYILHQPIIFILLTFIFNNV